MDKTCLASLAVDPGCEGSSSLSLMVKARTCHRSSKVTSSKYQNGKRWTGFEVSNCVWLSLFVCLTNHNLVFFGRGGGGGGGRGRGRGGEGGGGGGGRFFLFFVLIRKNTAFFLGGGGC